MRRRPKAFTLIEVLLSAAMLALLMSALFSAHHTAHRALQAGRERFELLRRGMVTVTRLRRILSSASPYRQRNERADFQGSDSRLVFVSLAHDPELAMAPVNYILSSEDGRVLLKRDGLAPLCKLWDEKTFETMPLPGLVKISLAYSDGSEWSDEWKLGSKGMLPAAVRLELTIVGDDPKNRLDLREIIRIEGARRPNQQ